jgi:hypothetical protein
MRGVRLLFLVIGVIVAFGLAQPLIYEIGGRNLVMLAWGALFLASAVASLFAPDAVVSANPFYLVGLETAETLKKRLRFGSRLVIAASLLWCVYWALAMLIEAR